MPQFFGGSRGVPATPGPTSPVKSFSESLKGLGQPIGYTLTAAAGSYSIAGVASTLKRGLVQIDSAGAYTYTGVASTLKRGYSLTANAGSYTYTGVASTLKRGYTATEAAGSYSISGVAATLTLVTHTPVAYSLTANVGSYLVSGVNSGTIYSRLLSAANGSYLLSGVAASLTYTPGSSAVHYTLTASAGAYGITGYAATLMATGATAYTLTCDAGAYVYTGVNSIWQYVDNSPQPTKVGGDDAPPTYKQRFQVQVKNKVHLFDSDQEAIEYLNSLKKKAQKKAVIKEVAKVDPAYTAMMAQILDFDDEQDIEDILMLL